MRRRLIFTILAVLILRPVVLSAAPEDDKAVQIVLRLNPVYRIAHSDEQFNTAVDSWVKTLFAIDANSRRKVFPLIVATTVTEMDPVARYYVLTSVGRACTDDADWGAWQGLLFRELLQCAVSEWPIDRSRFEEGLARMNVPGGLQGLAPADALSSQCATSVALALLEGAQGDPRRFEAFLEILATARVCRDGPVCERLLGAKNGADTPFAGVINVMKPFPNFNKEAIAVAAQQLTADNAVARVVATFADRIKQLETEMKFVTALAQANRWEIDQLKEFRANAQVHFTNLDQQVEQNKAEIARLLGLEGRMNELASALGDQKKQIEDLIQRAAQQQASQSGVRWHYNAQWTRSSGESGTRRADISAPDNVDEARQRALEETRAWCRQNGFGDASVTVTDIQRI